MRNPGRFSWLSFAASFVLLASAASAVDIEWVTVGDPENECDQRRPTLGCLGTVDEIYRISKFEVTNAQYAEFLNAAAATDTNGLNYQNGARGSTRKPQTSGERKKKR